MARLMAVLSDMKNILMHWNHKISAAIIFCLNLRGSLLDEAQVKAFGRFESLSGYKC